MQAPWGRPRSFLTVPRVACTLLTEPHTEHRGCLSHKVHNIHRNTQRGTGHSGSGVPAALNDSHHTATHQITARPPPARPPSPAPRGTSRDVGRRTDPRVPGIPSRVPCPVTAPHLTPALRTNLRYSCTRSHFTVAAALKYKVSLV